MNLKLPLKEWADSQATDCSLDLEALEKILLPASPERLQELLRRVEADWGFEYSNQDGKEALQELRQLIGGEPHPNVKED